MGELEYRAKYRPGLSSLYQPFYDVLCKELGPEWQPYCGLRTFDEQAKLFAQGRTTKGPKVTNARPGQSPHNYASATDWAMVLNGKFVWPPANDPRWLVFGKAVQKVGLRWGADWDGDGNTLEHALRDCPHAELKISCSWSHILVAHGQGGMRAAQEKIAQSLVK